MKNILLSLFLLLSFKCHCQSIETQEVTLSAECEPLTSVGGCVNVASGHFFQAEEDLVTNTIDSLKMGRYYDSGSQVESFLGYGFGSQFPLFASDIQDGSRHGYAMISERDGYLVPYKSKNHTNFTLDPRILEKGYTNLGRSSAEGNFVNFRALHKPFEWNLQLGNGSKRVYGRKFTLSESNCNRMKFPTRNIYFLSEETKPNGNKLVYNYLIIDGRPHLANVKTLSRSGIPLNELNFTYSDDGCFLTSSCGGKVDYAQDEVKLHSATGVSYKKILKHTISSQFGTSVFKNQGSRISSIHKDNQCLEVEYYPSHKVRCLKEPLGANGALIPTYYFEYGNNLTKVNNAAGYLTNYLFDSSKRLAYINYYDKINNKDQLLRKDSFIWSPVEGQEGWLQAKMIQQGSDKYYIKSFEYDQFGNVASETIYGNLTGEKDVSFTHPSQADSLTTTFEYNKLNHVTKKTIWTPKGPLVTTYDYLEGTNLCTQEFVEYKGRIQERIFRTFDDNGQVSLLIEDNGSSSNYEDVTDVTVRVMQVTQAVSEPGPSFGKPKLFEHFYYQNGQNILLKKIEFTYDERGYEIENKVYYDNQCDITKKSYDERGRLTSETNPLNETIRFVYDSCNNKTEEELIGSGKITFFEYDLGNRLICKKDIHQEGDEYITTYNYNPMHQLVSETDPYGQITEYAYDRFENQTECIKPFVQNADGRLIRPSVKRSYNILGQAVNETDENGFTTNYTYNLYGKPTCINYPDGACEYATYYPNGWLKQEWHADGTSVKYDYDHKGHILSEKAVDAHGNTLRIEEWSYEGDLLKSKKDAMGLVTTYQYDGAGRKISEKTLEKLTLYQYDSLGRLTKTINTVDQTGPSTNYKYDSLDRLIEKTVQDRFGKATNKEIYRYDIQGNKVEEIHFHNENQKAVYRWVYHSDGTLISQTDPLGHTENRAYNHSHHNGAGQQVQCRSIRDPLDRETREADDTHQRVVRRDLYQSDKIVSSNHFDYDARDNLVREHVHVMQDGETIRQYYILRTYNERNYLVAEQEEPSGVKTHYHYDLRGRLIQKEKPDGISLYFNYDPLGRLHRISSTDQTVDYEFAYDLNDNPIEVKDHIHGIVQKKEYDSLNRLTKEENSLGVCLHFSYDPLDRLTNVTLPDGSALLYHYDDCHLRQIERNDPFGKKLYTCTCEAYDGRGHLLKKATPAGITESHYDLLERQVTIKTSDWESHMKEFDSVGNLLTLIQKNSSEQRFQFAYDRFDHLSKEEGNEYSYDSLGNCTQRNGKRRTINELNQIINEDDDHYEYDLNGNLISEPNCSYKYDALNRLTQCNKNGKTIEFVYDSSGNCLQINENGQIKNLFYQNDREIGSLQDKKIEEFRLTHGEHVFAIELKDELFFPIQDARFNICALQKPDGSVAESYSYSAFAEEYGENYLSPWRFANRRAIEGLVLYKHRLYNPRLMRWQTKDPLGFEDGLNLYAYVRNNPFKFTDPSGEFAFVIPLITVALPSLTVSFITFETVAMTACAALAGYGVYQINKLYEHKLNQAEAKDNPRTEPKDLEEQLALEEAKGGSGKEINPDKLKIKDPKYPPKDWMKKQHEHVRHDGDTINIHYWENRHTGEREGHKFKNK